MTPDERWALVESSKGIMWSIAIKWRVPSDIRDDVFHDAMVELYRQSPKFDPDRGSWGAFAYVYLLGYIADAMRHHLRIFGPKSGRELSERSGMLDAHVGCDHIDVDDLIDGAFIRGFVGNLDPRSRRVVDAYMNGESGQAIAAELGVTRQRVEQIRSKAFETLAGWMERTAAARCRRRPSSGRPHPVHARGQVTTTPRMP